MKKSRIKVSDVNIYTKLLPEVNNSCPLCGKFPLSKEKNGKTFKDFEIAHIYPHSPTVDQLVNLNDVVKPENIESLDNVIILCKSCHSKQDFNTTKQEYIKLYNIKSRLKNNFESKNRLASQNIDDSIKIIIESFKKIKPSDINQLDLTLHPLKIDQKINNDFILSESIKNHVVMYYYYIQEQFQNLVDSHPITFNIIGSQIKTAYLQASYSGISQQEIYNHLVLWLESITPEIPNNTACQIVISFFVQNCEVFDEITK